MVFTGWMGVVLLGVAAVFGYHLWVGWRTRVVRFPMSILTLEEFEHERSPANFWGVMTADLVGLVVAFTAASFVLGNALIVSPKPIADLRTLNGCYEGQGLPDFMRPSVHWVFRLDNGSISNRAGETVARLRLLPSTSSRTSVVFSPGILISTDEHKSSTVYAGDANASQSYVRGAVAGEAYTSNNRATIRLINDWGDVLLKTTCG